MKKGQILISLLIFSFIAISLITGLATWGSINIKASQQAQRSELALQIAEAGVEYYRWHLAHASQDFQDGTGHAGPYAHPFSDKTGQTIGQFTLDITPPPVGSTVVSITSTGTIPIDNTLKRKIKVKLAIPSLAKYAVLANDDIRFDQGTEVSGPIHANGGIHFDGLAHNIVTSAKASYTDPDHSGGAEFGVHTHINPADPLPPAAVPARSDVFEAGRQFPLPVVDFAGITADLAQIKTNAQAQGKYFAPSGALGYHIILKTDNTFDLYKVTALENAPNGCSDKQSDWGTWSIKPKNGEQFLASYPFPANGLIFTEDNLWVEGQINNARLTLASAKFPDNSATRTSITVNNDLLYTNYNGSDVLALIAQNNVNVGLKSKDVQRIDGALIAQNGRVGNYYYNNNCGKEYLRTALTLYGMIGTNHRYGFAWTCDDKHCSESGYSTRTIIYDANLLYGPPPSFPLTSSQYTTLSWEEVK